MKHLLAEVIKTFVARPTLGMAAALLALGVFVSVYFANGGQMFSPGDLNTQSRGKVALGGVRSHAEIAQNCAACHAPPFSGETMATRCMECHTDVRQQIDSNGSVHGKMANGQDCRSCHTEHKGPHSALTDMASFDHDWAAFKLTGHHRTAECKSCHVETTFKNTPQTCVACHAEPKVHAGKFGVDCAKCHSTTTFALTGGTVGLAEFDHDTTAFKLTGKHLQTDCRACHVNNVFKGTSTTCVSCHAEPTVHKGKFGLACVQCHSTTNWDGAFIKHAFFSIDHRGSKGSCAKCHNDPYHFTTYTCYNCHEHTPAKEENRPRHVLVKQKRNLVSIANCADCHSRKLKGRLASGTQTDDASAVLDAVGFLASCSVSSNGSCPVGFDAFPLGTKNTETKKSNIHDSVAGHGNQKVDLFSAAEAPRLTKNLVIDRSQLTTFLLVDPYSRSGLAMSGQRGNVK